MKVEGSGFRAWDLGGQWYRVQFSGIRVRVWVEGVEGEGFSVQGLGLGFGVQGWGLRV